MTKDQIAKVITDLPALAPLDAEVRRNVAKIIASISAPRMIKKGTVWLKRGKPSENKGYILLSGSVSIDKPTSPLTSCPAPELLGEGMQFNPSQVRTATVTAEVDCAVLRFLWEDFWKHIDETLDENQRKQVRDTIEDYAWKHFAE